MENVKGMKWKEEFYCEVNPIFPFGTSSDQIVSESFRVSGFSGAVFK